MSSYGFCQDSRQSTGFSRLPSPTQSSSPPTISHIPSTIPASSPTTKKETTTSCPPPTPLPAEFDGRRCLAQVGVQCYGLPYGGWGTASDVLTIYTVMMLSLGRRPYLPWKHLKGEWFDVWLAVTSVLGTVITSIYTIVHCAKFNWSFATIAAWRMVLSLSFTLMSYHAGRIRKVDKAPHDTARIGRWLLLYANGLVAGLAALFYISYVNPGLPDSSKGTDWAPFAIFTAALVVGFATCLGMWILTSMSFSFPDHWNPLWTFKHDPWIRSRPYQMWATAGVVFVIYFGVILVFASDWMLATIAQNYGGSPTDDSKLSEHLLNTCNLN